jgi:hypothetical protein
LKTQSKSEGNQIKEQKFTKSYILYAPAGSGSLRRQANPRKEKKRK